MMNNYKLEVCVDSLESAIAAQKGGADRIELCDNLYEGGTTPSAGMIEIARKYLDLKIQVIIRPRGGDFLYSDREFEVMKKDIEFAKKMKADGVVIGILKSDATIDIEKSKELVELARPISVTFHRAFDMTPDPFKALEDVINTGADRLLTSGQLNEAPQGAKLIAELVSLAGDRIIIMPGAGINQDNIHDMVNITGACEYHLTGSEGRDSKMRYRNPRVFMGGLPEIPEYERMVTSEKIIRSVVKVLNSIRN
jgi:copper homeostasis protein